MSDASTNKPDAMDAQAVQKLETAAARTADTAVLVRPNKVVPSGIKTETVDGAAWLRNYLHPPSANVNQDPTYSGYPDRSTQNSVRMTFKGAIEKKLMSSDVVPVSAQKYLDLWYFGMQQWNSSWKFAGSGLGPPVYDGTGSISQVTYKPPNWAQDVSVARRNFGSASIYQDETNFSNRGTITVASFAPNYIDVVGFTALTAFVSEWERKNGRRLKTYSGSKLVDYSSTLDEDPVLVNGKGLMSSISLSRFVLIDRLPQTMNEVMNLSGKSYTGMLKDGAFIINRLFQDTNLYEPGEVMVLNLIEGITGVVTTLSNSPEWVSRNFMMSWVFYDNMQVTDAGGGVLTSGNHILYKMFNGVEVIPELHSSLNPFVRPCAFEDQLALRMGANILHDAPDADVVSTNSLGTILQAALKAAPKVIDWLGGVTKSEVKQESQGVALGAKKEAAMKAEIADLKDLMKQMLSANAPRVRPMAVVKAAPSVNAPAKRKKKRKMVNMQLGNGSLL